MGLKRVSWVRRYQGQCRAVRLLGHQGYRLRNHKKDQPLCSGYTSLGRQQSACHWRCAVHGGRGPPYHSGSCSPGFSGYDLCGVLARRRGLACSSRPPWGPAAGAGGRVALRLLSRAGGDHPPCLGGWGPGPQRPAGRWGGGGGASRRGLPAPLLGGDLRYSILAPFVSPARSLPACACSRGRSAAPGWGGVRGVPRTAPPGALADLNPPSALPEWAVVTGGSCGARPPYCSVVRVAPARQCGLAGAGPAAAPPTASPPRLRGGGGPRPWLPSWGGAGGGGECGGPSGPLAMPPDGRGGGRHGSPGPGGQPSGGGSRPSPVPLYLEPDPRAGPRWGPSSHRPLSRRAGRPGAAVRVSSQWLAGCGAAGSLPRSLSPYSLPREVARSHAWCRTMGGAWVGGPGSSPHSRASAVWAITCAAGCVLSMGGVAPHTTPVRAHPASLGTICAASRCAGVGPLVLRGPHVSRRMGRGGRSHSGSPLGRGGARPPRLGGWGPGPPRLAAGGGAGGGGRAAASLFSFRAAACGTPFRPSSCRRCAPFRRARAVGAEVPPRVGGVRGGLWTAPPGPS